ncbi:GlxA family transcriptional regulator [Undibacterium pigrum]|uniref:AraC family transcriptional regulator with amidase-like domain n=1 Tax=Undibacterium pigrum TaxID=401470 RepID=A0A318JE35_9BURK|nr:helix-turn-helix domain-containing protein [Undibacterium pigrum]PXX38562.1 AraC family transcriptional regulator with amidase-like domain [Undibacterium pigrum]
MNIAVPDAVPIPVYFLLLPGFILMEFAGTAEALRLANRDRERFALHFVGPEPAPRNSLGMLTPDLAPLSACLPEGAWLLIPGLTDASINLQTPAAIAAMRWLREVMHPGIRLVTICSAALLAARAGLLDGRECTTHYTVVPGLKAAAPAAIVIENRVFVIDGNIATSAGVTTGVDLILEFISQSAGPRLALEVAREMVVWMRRDAASPQLSPYLMYRNHLHPAIHRVQDAIAADPAQAWPMHELARIACLSERHLARLFKTHVGVSPLDYRQQMQLSQVQPLMAQANRSMEQIADLAGFGSARDMRRVWLKHKGVPLRA